VGLPVTVDDVPTAPALTAAYLAEHYPDASCLLLNSGDIGADLNGVRLIVDDTPADVVIIGGAGEEFSYAALNRAFAQLRNGARLVAMHRNLYWRTREGLQLDGGAFLLGLEAAASVTAEVVGKPTAGFFTSALRHLHVDATEAVMIGDDIDADVLGAQRVGITGVLVRTGKFLPDALAAADGVPDHVVGSIADVPDLLARLD
jgi:HAD superfamily hydrolase (TIGR01458 family)